MYLLNKLFRSEIRQNTIQIPTMGGRKRFGTEYLGSFKAATFKVSKKWHNLQLSEFSFWKFDKLYFVENWGRQASGDQAGVRVCERKWHTLGCLVRRPPVLKAWTLNATTPLLFPYLGQASRPEGELFVPIFVKKTCLICFQHVRVFNTCIWGDYFKPALTKLSTYSFHSFKRWNAARFQFCSVQSGFLNNDTLYMSMNDKF